jgi:hypothetical protein
MKCRGHIVFGCRRRRLGLETLRRLEKSVRTHSMTPSDNQHRPTPGLDRVQQWSAIWSRIRSRRRLSVVLWVKGLGIPPPGHSAKAAFSVPFGYGRPPHGAILRVCRKGCSICCLDRTLHCALSCAEDLMRIPKAFASEFPVH